MQHLRKTKFYAKNGLPLKLINAYHVNRKIFYLTLAIFVKQFPKILLTKMLYFMKKIKIRVKFLSVKKAFILKQQ